MQPRTCVPHYSSSVVLGRTDGAGASGRLGRDMTKEMCLQLTTVMCIAIHQGNDWAFEGAIAKLPSAPGPRSPDSVNASRVAAE